MKRVLATAAIVAGLLAAGSVFAHEGHNHGHEHGPWSKQEETLFLQRTMNRHARVAEVGKLARQRATRPMLRAWGDSVSRAHTVETRRIQTMLQTDYQVTPSKPAAAATSLAKVKGAAFDQALLSLVVRDLGEGLGEARDCQSMGTSPDLKSACTAWAALQRKEVITAGGWLCEWFKECR